jgi:hypothetical protein
MSEFGIVCKAAVRIIICTQALFSLAVVDAFQIGPGLAHWYGCAIYRLAGCIRRILYTLAYIYGFSVLCNVYLDARFFYLRDP